MRNQLIVMIYILAFISFYQNGFATIKPLEIPEGITFSVNMLATDPDDPPFLGPPIKIITAEVERIQSASITVDISPFTVETISPANNAGGFDITYTENGSIVTIQAQRTAQTSIVGGTEFLEIDVKNNEPIDFGVGFGELKILDAFIAHYTRELVQVVINDGSWMFITDFVIGFNLKIVDPKGSPVFTGFQLFLLGMGRAPELYQPNEIRLEFNEATESYFVPHHPNPDVLHQTEVVDGCRQPVPEAVPLVYLFRLDPPPGSLAPSLLLEIENTPQPICDDFEPLPDVVYQWPPETPVMNWTLY